MEGNDIGELALHRLHQIVEESLTILNVLCTREFGKVGNLKSNSLAILRTRIHYIPHQEDELKEFGQFLGRLNLFAGGSSGDYALFQKRNQSASASQNLDHMFTIKLVDTYGLSVLNSVTVL
jgi:hypothetical protein